MSTIQTSVYTIPLYMPICIAWYVTERYGCLWNSQRNVYTMKENEWICKFVTVIYQSSYMLCKEHDMNH